VSLSGGDACFGLCLRVPVLGMRARCGTTSRQGRGVYTTPRSSASELLPSPRSFTRSFFAARVPPRLAAVLLSILGPTLERGQLPQSSSTVFSLCWTAPYSSVAGCTVLYCTVDTLTASSHGMFPGCLWWWQV